MTKQNATILVIDDDQDILISARLYLKQFFSSIITCQTPKDINKLLSEHEVDVILLDMNYRKGINDGKEGLYWLSHILSVDPEHIVVLMTSFGDVELAVNALKSGATDFILKPWNNEKLQATVSAALKLRQASRKVKRLEKTQQSLQSESHKPSENMVGSSEAMKAVQKIIGKVAPTDANVLILGENGTGKQVVAREIHRLGNRAGQVFMHVDLGALNENLFESELFGYAKGAFTDAREDTPGRFELAEGGTIFLDEIGNLSLPLQAKLLHVLQNRSVTRLGESRERPVNVRLVCATNAELHQLVEKNLFRQDLLYRINTMEITLPPLRERKEDAVLLADHYLHLYKHKYKKPELTFGKAVYDKIRSYPWPGNIRELQHVTERAVIMCDGNEIMEEDMQLNAKKFSTGILPEDSDLESVEKLLIRKSLDKHQGNISKAASELGLTRAALYRRIEKHGL